MKTTLRAMALMAALFSANPLSAANIMVTWTGTVLSGIDDSNTFGLGIGSDLTGQSFTATFLIDPTLGFIQNPPDFFSTVGGTDAPGFATPILSASLSINSMPFSFQSDKFGGYQRDGTPGRSDIYTEAQHQSGAAVDALFVRVFRLDNSIPFTGIGETLAIALASDAFGIFQAFTPGGAARLFAGNLTPTFVRIEPENVGPGPIPEPSSAVLLVSGVGLLIACRRFYRPM